MAKDEITVFIGLCQEDRDRIDAQTAAVKLFVEAVSRLSESLGSSPKEPPAAGCTCQIPPPE